MLTVAVAACNPQPDVGNQGAGGKEAIVRPAGSAVIDIPSRPFFPVNKIERPLLPASNAFGQLALEGERIIFVSGAGKSLPIRPSGSTLHWDGSYWLINSHDRSLRVGTGVGLPGGYFTLENRSEVRIDGKIPSSCPNNTYAVARA